MHPPAVRTVLPLFALAASLVVSIQAPAQAQPDTGQLVTGSVATVTDSLAHRLASTLAQPAARARVISAVVTGPADLATLKLGTSFTNALTAGNHAVQAAKGLPTTADSLLRVRLAHPDMRAALDRGELPLVAATPTDDTATSMIGYEPTGGRVRLDALRAPQRSVLLVEVDVAKALPMGLRLMSDLLTTRHVDRASTSATMAGGYWATKINAVRLSDDEEPWFKGDAEIYSIVGGFGLDGNPKIDIVQMPYLNNDGTTYYPNQLLVHFSAYKYNLADAVMMEDDGDTNYQQLAQAIASALLAIVDGGAYAPLVSAILSAIPTSWWTDDPDYVDSWYTLATTSGGRLYGAAANGWMDVSPYWVPAF